MSTKISGDTGVNKVLSSEVVPYDNTVSGLAATNAQEAIDEIGALSMTHTNGLATFTSIDNQIVLTGIVPTLALEVGDVIQIQYTGYDKLHTVESITDDDTIVVNYEHYGARGNGSLKLPDYSGIATVKRIAKWYSSPPGLGQAWVELSSLRAFNTDYLNSTGRTIHVASISNASGSSKFMSITSDGVFAHGSHVGYTSALWGAVDSLGVIPNTSTYRITASGSNVIHISELR